MSAFAGGGYNYSFNNNEPIQRVYDLSYYGYDLTIYPLDPNPATVTAITNSTATRAAANDSTTTPAGSPISTGWDLILSNTDTIPLLSGAADTDLNVTFQFVPDMTALVHEVNFNVWFGMAVTAFTSGTATLSNVAVKISYQDTGEIVGNGIGVANANTGLAALASAVGTLFNFNATISKPFIVLQERTLLFNFTTTSSKTGTNTRQVGICSMGSFGKQLATAAPLMYTPSAVRLHIHPTVTHVNPNFVSGQGAYP